MLCKFLLALYALPLISAAPLDPVGVLGDILSGDSNQADSLLDQPVGAVLPIDQIVKNPANIIENVNAVLGNVLPDRIDSRSQYEETLNNIRQQVTQNEQLFATFAGLFQAIVKAYTPQSIPEALQQLSHTLGNGTNGVTLESIGLALLNGLSTADLTQNVLSGYLSDINSFNNDNPPIRSRIYPRKSSTDAPYTIPEAQLRSALYIPPTFTYGTKRPILFIPGTGAFGGVNFISNLGKLLSPSYDPVYLNVPGAMYNDTQLNAEYIAYATNYLSALTTRADLALIAWSQGNLDTQWAFQYYPSTRPVVSDFISVSADFHGTTVAYFLDPALPLNASVPLPPSVIQQEYSSNFVTTLRAAGGFAPYAPSTSIYSLTDEIVQPQYDPYASAAYFSRDLPTSPATCATTDPPQGTHPYTNTLLQRTCPSLPAGGPYLHEGVLYNALTYALVVDALEHDGPGRVERLDLDAVCNQVVAPGLSLDDVLATEGLIPLAAVNLLLYPGKVMVEPQVRAFATAGRKVECGGEGRGVRE